MASAEVMTPERAGNSSPQRQTIALTEAQKQALVDNLQLEITERARKLRAQYAFQAQGLRARLELRINRIPHTLRKTNMQDLVDKYSDQNKPASSSPQKLHHISQLSTSPVKNKGLKRSSDHFTTSDKENALPATTPATVDLANPKKRSKPNTTSTTTTTTTALPLPSSPPTRTTRPPTALKKPTTILSPKSHNSRTLPRSPLKSPPPPSKPAASTRPATATATATATTSKPVTTITKPTRTASRTTKRAPPTTTTTAAALTAIDPIEPRKLRTSISSDTSAGTTVVRTTKTTAATTTLSSKRTAAAAKEVAAPAPAPVPAVKKTGTLKSAFNSLTGSKRGKAAAAAAAAAVKEVAPASTTTAGGRVLRKRG